jgi:hypothetical protein
MMRKRSYFWNVRLLPISIALIAISWIFLLQVYLLPGSKWVPWILIGMAFLLLVFRIFGGNREPWTERLILPRWSGWLGLISCLAALVIFPYPYQIGTLPLGAGWIVMTLTRRHSLGRYFASALVQTGLLLTISAACLPFVFAWAARVHELSALAYVLSPLTNLVLKLLGQSAGLANLDLQLRTFEDLFQQSITTEKLLPIPLLLFAVLWTGFIVFRQDRKKIEKVLLFWAGLTAYAILRYVVLLLIMVQRVSPNYFWEPAAITLSLLPLALILREPLEMQTSKVSSTIRSKIRLPGGYALLLGLILGAASVAAFTFRDPGNAKAGRVLINEHGSDWEWTNEPLDTLQYSEKTTYNYYCMAEFLKYYYQVETNFEPLTPKTLDNIDILILKTPTQAYAPSEIECIVQFVHQGGGLWVIGDHTNVFGSSSFFNPLIRRFGFRLRYDSTHDLQSGKLSLWRKPPMFAHPSVQNLPPYLFATSCSISAPWSSESAILGYGLRTDHLDYSQKNFFPDRSRKQFSHGFGLFLQQATTHFGKGRLLIYTDSTTFSNFFMFIKGKPELVLGSLGWLNHRNQWLWVNTGLIILAIAAVIIMLIFNGWNGAALSGILLGAAISGWLVERQTLTAYPLPDPVRSVPRINFERQHSDYFLPRLRLAEDNDKSYLTFFVWTQRLGVVPWEADDLIEAIQTRDPLVMIDPVVPLSREEAMSLNDYLLQGGKLLVINSADNASNVPQKLLEAYGIDLKVKPAGEDTIRTLTLAGRIFPLIVNGRISIIAGGEPFLKSDQDEVIGVSMPVGNGGIWVVSCGHLFRNSSMGQTTVSPDEGLKALYAIEYSLIDALMSPETLEDDSLSVSPS